MAFGQHQGLPASARDVDRLLVLVRAAGHRDFRDARGPLGFTQRQAAGKFTRDEIEVFINRLENEEFCAGEPSALAAPTPKVSAAEQSLRRLPAELLAAELQRRGWIVAEP